MYRVRHQIGYDMHFFCRENPNNYAVAIVDSGIIRHPDLERQVIAFYDFSNEKYIQLTDGFGHGTHVAGCLCGDGYLSKGRYHGICPNAKLVVLKVLNKNGVGEAKWLIDALKYILENYKKCNIKIVNLSLGVEKDVDRESLEKIRELVSELIRKEIYVVCAAGNYGPENNTIYGIGTMKEVITVGCYDGLYEKKGEVSCKMFSGRGDKGALVVKPDIVAPGTKIISCSHKYAEYKSRKINFAYEEKSGTSMSAPIISGILFGIILNYPDLTYENIRKKLLYATNDVGYEKNMQGNGFINCKKIWEK